MPMKNPVHPGNIIREDVFAPLGISVTKAAEVLKVRRATLSDLLNGRSALTAEMAVRIEQAFGPKADHLMEVQKNYSLAQARRHAKETGVRRYHAA